MADGGTLDDFGDPTPRPDTDPEEDCAAEDYAAEEASRPADIIFAVDASGSMRGEARAVQNQLTRFATEVLATEVDPHVIMITSPSYVTVPPPLGTDAERFLMVPEQAPQCPRPVQRCPDVRFPSPSAVLILSAATTSMCAVLTVLMSETGKGCPPSILLLALVARCSPGDVSTLAAKTGG